MKNKKELERCNTFIYKDWAGSDIDLHVKLVPQSNGEVIFKTEGKSKHSIEVEVKLHEEKKSGFFNGTYCLTFLKEESPLLKKSQGEIYAKWDDKDHCMHLQPSEFAQMSGWKLLAK